MACWKQQRHRKGVRWGRGSIAAPITLLLNPGTIKYVTVSPVFSRTTSLLLSYIALPFGLSPAHAMQPHVLAPWLMRP